MRRLAAVLFIVLCCAIALPAGDSFIKDNVYNIDNPQSIEFFVNYLYEGQEKLEVGFSDTPVDESNPIPGEQPSGRLVVDEDLKNVLSNQDDVYVYWKYKRRAPFALYLETFTQLLYGEESIDWYVSWQTPDEELGDYAVIKGSDDSADGKLLFRNMSSRTMDYGISSVELNIWSETLDEVKPGTYESTLVLRIEEI